MVERIIEVNSELLFKYIDINLVWKKEKPIFKFKIKDEYRITSTAPIKGTYKWRRIPMTGEKYYVHYLGKEIGKDIYNERRKLYSLYNLIPFYIKHFNITDDRLLQYLTALKTKTTKGLVDMYNSSKGMTVRRRLSDIGKENRHRNSIRMTQLWKDEEFRKKCIENRDYSYENHGRKVSEFYQDPKNRDYISHFMNNPTRLESISKKSKDVWHNVRENDRDLFYRMIMSHKSTKYQLNGYNLNQIEFLMGKMLNELNLTWVHAKIFNFENNCYFPDFYIESHNAIIECYGDYWHANPKYMTENQFTHKKRSVKEVWEYDNKKKFTFEENKYKYLVFWEEDILKNDEIIKEKIKYECNI